MPSHPDKKTLYERLGGDYVINMLVCSFFDGKFSNWGGMLLAPVILMKS